MIKLEEFLLKNIEDIGEYALVSYNGTTKAIWFAQYWSDIDNKPWFLESPCVLRRICEVDKPIDEFCKEYMENCIELIEDASEEDYIENFVKPMIMNGWFYEIENFQTEPYLPKEVDSIKIISERECLEWMLENTKN